MVSEVPLAAEELTPQWLTRVLRDGGWLGAGEVAHVRMEAVGVGQGHASQIHRVHAEYEGESGELPGSFVVKLPHAASALRQQASGFGLYRREVLFYQLFAESSPLRVPRCYWSALGSTGDGALLLEDLARARVLDQLEGCPVELAHAALEQLGSFHARWWQHPLPQSQDWLMRNIQKSAELVGVRFREAIAPFEERHGSWLPSSLRGHLEEVAQLLTDDGARGARDDNTLQHGDFRLENLMLERGGRVCMVDFQLLRWGPGAADIAYFLGQSLDTTERRAHERALLATYHRALRAGGVDRYDEEALERSYRKGLVLALKIPVLGARTVAQLEEEAAGGGGAAEAAAKQLPAFRKLTDTVSRRAVTAVVDWDALALVGR